LLERFGRAGVQQGTQGKGHIRRVPYFHGCCQHQLRQTLAAIVGSTTDAVPAAFHKLLIGFFETIGGKHAASFQAHALRVAGFVERSQYLTGQLGRFVQNRLDQIRRCILIAWQAS